MAHTITVNTTPDYTISIANHALRNPTLIQAIQALQYRVIIITDSNVASLYAEHLQQALDTEMLILPAGEQYKTREQKAKIEDQMQQLGYGRDTYIIAIGGGVVTDIAGFIAATYCRGVPVMYIPTTLLAMVDAAVGGKTGVNTPQGKNLIGAFKQPHQVVIDPTTLHSLSTEQLTNGLVEAIKHGLIHCPTLYQHLMTNAQDIIHHRYTQWEQLIFDSIQVKCHVVEQDCHEKGIRQILNLGHTVAHALEKAHQFQLAHGHAVAHGIIIDTHMASLEGYCTIADYAKIKTDLQQLPLQSLTLDTRNIPSLIEVMKRDKKSHQQQLFYVPLKTIGQTYHSNQQFSMATNENTVIQALTEYLSTEPPLC